MTFEERAKSLETDGLFSSKITLWDKVTKPFWVIKIGSRNAFYNLKYRCQRFIRGYSDEDVFELAYNLREKLIPMLEEFIKIHHGYPGDSTPEEYNDKLGKMLYHLKMADKHKISEQMKKKYKWYCEEYFRECDEIFTHHTDEFFKLFHELFWTLWD